MEDNTVKASSKSRAWRFFALIAVLAMIAAACGTGDTTADDGDTGDDGTPETTTTTQAQSGDTGGDDGGDDGGPTTEFTYQVAIFSDPTTDNAWAVYDTENDVWTNYVIGSQAAALYTLQPPSYTLAPSVAADPEPPAGSADGDNWVIDINLRDDATWSDGSPITANDVAFTFNTVKDLGLGGNWLSTLPIAQEDDPDTADVDESEALGVISVEALSDTQVRYTWNGQPGLSVYQFGAAQHPIYSEAYWADAVASAGSLEDLYAASGADALSAGAFVTAERQEGAFWRNEAVDNYWDSGTEVTVFVNGSVLYGDDLCVGGDCSGDIRAQYTEGPYATETVYTLYQTQDAAVLALRDGEVDFLLNPLGLQRGLQGLVLEAEDLNIISNPSNGFRYLAFNTRQFPGSDLSFRQAIACMIDKEFMANNILQGVAIPLDSLVPPGNSFWYNDAVEPYCAGLTQEERVLESIRILEDGGWTWSTKPEWNADNLDVIPKGEGLNLNGQTMGDLELLAPGPGYDPLRATYSLFIEDWANDLGIPVVAEPTGFSVIVDRVFGPVDWDMYILGWGVSTFPDYVADFFVTSGDSATGGFNTPGYSNPDFDALAEELRGETDLQAARDLVFEMDAIIARDVPYVVLFTTPVLEAYRNTLNFPFTDPLDGLQNFGGVPTSVNQG